MALITAPQAAEILGTTRWSVRRLVEKGVLVPLARTGKRNQILLFDRAEVERFAAKRRDIVLGATA